MKCYKILTTAITGMSTPRFPALLDAWWEIKSGQNFTILFILLLCLYVIMVVCTPSKLVPFQRLSHSLAFLPDPVGQIVPKGSPLTRPQVAPPAGLQLYSPERLSLPESNACTPQREHLYRGSEDLHIHATHLKQIKAQKVRTKTNTCDPSSTSSCVNWVVNSKIRC